MAREFVSRRGLSVAQGGDGKRLVVLLHGLGANRSVWSRMLAIAGEHWQGRWMAPDLRGHGRSPMEGPYGYATHAADIAELIAGEDPDNVTLAGHSMGGVVAALAGSGWYGPHVREAAAFGVKLVWTSDEEAKARALSLRPARAFATRAEAIDRFLKGSGLFGLVAPDSDTAASGVTGGDGQWQVAFDPRCFGAVGPSIPALMKLSAAPLRLTAGAKNPMVTREHMRAIDPAARIFDGAGHNAHWEAPAAVWDFISNKTLSGTPKDSAMRMSIFSVQDHYPSHARTVPQLYAEIIAQAELADALGYDTFWVAEHHFHEYGVVPNPAVMLSTLAQRTTRLRLGTAISILTFHNPLTVAESYAMVDVLSGGRLVYGVGSGYLSHEFAGYAVDPAEKRDRFDENLAIVRRLLAGERVTAKGKYSNVDAVQLNLRPIQKEVPIYVAVLRREAAFHIGKQGNNLMCVPYASLDDFDQIGDLIAEYRRGKAEAGVAPSDDDAVVTLHTHVAESDEAARRDAEQPFNLYVDTRLYARKSTYDDAMRNGLHLFGSVDTVTDKLVALHRMGVRHVSTLQNFGLLPQPIVRASMERLIREVMPRVAARIGEPATAAKAAAR